MKSVGVLVLWGEEELGSQGGCFQISFQISQSTQPLLSVLQFLDLNPAYLVPEGRDCSEGRI